MLWVDVAAWPHAAAVSVSATVPAMIVCLFMIDPLGQQVIVGDHLVVGSIMQKQIRGGVGRWES